GSGPTSCRKVSETSVGVVELTSRTPGGQAVAHQAPRRTRLTCTDGRHEEIRGRGATVLRGAGNFRGRASRAAGRGHRRAPCLGGGAGGSSWWCGPGVAPGAAQAVRPVRSCACCCG